MAKDNYTDELKYSLKEYGFEVRGESGRMVQNGKIKRWISSAPDDEADLFCIRQWHGVFIEVKSFDGKSWGTRSWTDEQRDWARRHHGVAHPVWIWLCGGVNPPNYDPVKYIPRQSWLIPFDVLIKEVEVLERIQYQFPIQRMANKSLRALDMTLEVKFEPYRLQWAGSGRWRFPYIHPFTKKYLDHKLHDPMFPVPSQPKYEPDQLLTLSGGMFNWSRDLPCYEARISGYTNMHRHYCEWHQGDREWHYNIETNEDPSFRHSIQYDVPESMIDFALFKSKQKGYVA